MKQARVVRAWMICGEEERPFTGCWEYTRKEAIKAYLLLLARGGIKTTWEVCQKKYGDRAVKVEIRVVSAARKEREG